MKRKKVSLAIHVLVLSLIVLATIAHFLDLNVVSERFEDGSNVISITYCEPFEICADW